MIKKIDDLIGNTPIISLDNIKKELNLNAFLYAKLEMFNLTGSIKDRVANAIINDAQKKGLLKKGYTVVDATSGNTGIGLAAVCASKGYKITLVLPENMSIERVKLLKQYGANVLLTKKEEGMAGSIEKVKQLLKEDPKTFCPDQFNSLINPEIHYLTTAKEIYDDVSDIDIFVSSIGTGGTISGVAKYLKEKNKNIKVIGIEPFNSPVITKGYKGEHNIQGIGAGFIPSILNLNLIDEVMTVKEEDAYYYAKLLNKKEGISCGISSGATLAVMVELSKTFPGKKIVGIFPDSSDRYLSTPLF